MIPDRKQHNLPAVRVLSVRGLSKIRRGRSLKWAWPKILRDCILKFWICPCHPPSFLPPPPLSLSLSLPLTFMLEISNVYSRVWYSSSPGSSPSSGSGWICSCFCLCSLHVASSPGPSAFFTCGKLKVEPGNEAMLHVHPKINFHISRRWIDHPCIPTTRLMNRGHITLPP